MAVETVFILGAGFSHYAGTPLQEKFAEDVLRGHDFSDEQPSKIIVDSLAEFVDYVFHVGTDVPWPAWEDLFTCLDLSANSGHHLGRKYSPRVLRTIRRAILSRIIRMLEQRYKNALKDKVQRIKIQRLDTFLSAIDVRKAAFVSLNWDAVLELRLMEQLTDVYFDYGSHVRRAQFKQSPDLRITAIDDKAPGQRIRIAKMHGATNWLYCDNCRRQFSFAADRTGSVAMQLMRNEDWRVLSPKAKTYPKSANWKCDTCRVLLGSRIATFSYRKALDSPILLKTWFFAEDLLREANNWVFIGYSLPEADCEFKYLLKQIELSRLKAPPPVPD